MSVRRDKVSRRRTTTIRRADRVEETDDGGDVALRLDAAKVALDVTRRTHTRLVRRRDRRVWVRCTGAATAALGLCETESWTENAPVCLRD